MFAPAADNEEGDNVFLLSFSEILHVLRFHTNNNQLKIYNLQTAMRKYQYQSRSARRGNGNPAYFYRVRLVRESDALYNVIGSITNVNRTFI